jgi:hypothetical protein
MSLVEREITSARVAASRANGQKSKGPKTPEGKARVSLNALKKGAYAMIGKARREIMLRNGENPENLERECPTLAGAESSSQPAVATPRGAADGALGAGPKSSPPSGLLSGVSFGQKAETVSEPRSEKGMAERETAVTGAVAPKNEKMAQSNLTSHL